MIDKNHHKEFWMATQCNGFHLKLAGYPTRVGPVFVNFVTGINRGQPSLQRICAHLFAHPKKRDRSQQRARR